MARTRRQWSDIRDEIKRLLRENSDDNPGWSDAALLDLFNQELDRLVMAHYEAHEGYFVQVFQADIVEDQATYELPEGAGDIKRVALVSSDGSSKEVLERNMQWSGVYDATSSGSGIYSESTYRLQDNFIEIYPTPAEDITDGLELEIEIAPDRIVNDADKVSDSLPPEAETLLILNTCVAAKDSEGAIASDRTGILPPFVSRRDMFEAAYWDMIQTRSFGRVIGQRMNWGA